MKELVEARSATRAANYKFRVKMFCSILKSALRDEAAFLERSKGDPNFEELPGTTCATSTNCSPSSGSSR
jgi:hypothetical protein